MCKNRLFFFRKCFSLPSYMLLLPGKTPRFLFLEQVVFIAPTRKATLNPLKLNYFSNIFRNLFSSVTHFFSHIFISLIIYKLSSADTLISEAPTLQFNCLAPLLCVIIPFPIFLLSVMHSTSSFAFWNSWTNFCSFLFSLLTFHVPTFQILVLPLLCPVPYWVAFINFPTGTKSSCLHVSHVFCAIYTAHRPIKLWYLTLVCFSCPLISAAISLSFLYQKCFCSAYFVLISHYRHLFLSIFRFNK